MFNKSTLFQKPGSEAPTPQNARGQRPLSPSTSPSGDPSANSRDPVGAFSTSSSSQTGNTSANSAARESKTPIEAGDVAGNQLIVGPNVKLKGAEILDCDILVVEGRVEATMDSRVIRVSENGSFSGTVGIDVAEIHGEFDGELTARSQLIIHSTGRVSGKIRYGKIFIEEGGEISGDIRALDARDGSRSASQSSVSAAVSGSTATPAATPVSNAA